MKRSSLACLLTTSFLISGADQQTPHSPEKMPTIELAEIQQHWHAKKLDLASKLVSSLTKTPPNIESCQFSFIDWMVQELIKNGQHDVANQMISTWLDQENVPGLQEHELMQHFIANIDELIDKGAYRTAEKVVRQWQEKEGLSIKQEASALLAQANIAEAERIYPLARAIFDSIVRDKQFENLPEWITANFGIIRIDRLTGALELSMMRAEQILKDYKDPLIQSRAFTEIAETHTANGNLEKAKKSVSKALETDAHNKQAKLLQAKLNLDMSNSYSAQDIVMSADASMTPVLVDILPAAPHALQHYERKSKNSDAGTSFPHTNHSKYKEQQLIPPSFVQVTNRNKTTTFSSDVDTASFYNTCFFVLDYKQLPEQNAIRSEEFINAFHYDYKEEGDRQEALSFANQVTVCPWNKDHLLLRVGLDSLMPEKLERPQLNFVFLVDTSGSMQTPNKLPLMQESLRILTRQLTHKDSVAIVTYAGSAAITLPPTSGQYKQRILRKINRLSTNGGTNGAEGITTAYALAAQMQKTAKEKKSQDNQQTRVFLATDGDFNVGITDNDLLLKLINTYREKNIFLNTVGFGAMNDQRMETLSNAGNGVATFIRNRQNAQMFFEDQFVQSTITIAKDTKIQIEFNPAIVKEYKAIGYQNRQLNNEDFANDAIDAGDIGLGHQATALFEIIPHPPQAVAKQSNNPNKKHAAQNTWAHIALIRTRYKDPDQEQSRLLTTTIPYQVEEADRNTLWAAGLSGIAHELRYGAQPGNWSTTDIKNLITELAPKFAQQNGDEVVKLFEQVQIIKAAAATQTTADAKPEPAVR